MNMDDIPKFKQKTTLAFVRVKINEDQKKFGHTKHAIGPQATGTEGYNVANRIVDDIRWFRKQYAENIGTSEGKKPKIRDVLIKLFANRKSVQENDTYTEPVNPKSDAHPFTWPNASLMNKCLCEDFQCACKGCTLMPPQEMPAGPVNWIDWKDFFTYKNRAKIPPVPAGTLIPNLKAKIKEEPESSAYLMSEGAVSPDCPQFCGSRCIAFKIQDAIKEAKYWYTPEQLKKLKNIENTFNPPKSSKDNKKAPVVRVYKI